MTSGPPDNPRSSVQPKSLNRICNVPFTVKRNFYSHALGVSTWTSGGGEDIPSLTHHVTLGRSLHAAGLCLPVCSDQVGVPKGPRAESHRHLRVFSKSHYGTRGPLGQVGC